MTIEHQYRFRTRVKHKYLSFKRNVFNNYQKITGLNYKNNIDSYLKKHTNSDLNGMYEKLKVDKFEGHSGELSEETALLEAYSKTAKNIFEIGFNAGHSSETFLKASSKSKVVSADLGYWHYVKYGEYYLNKMYPNRHTLIKGDSIKSVISFAKSNKTKFDLIFVDGNHDYKYAFNDIVNCKNLADENSLLLVDDIERKVNNQTGKNIGPTKAWDELIKSSYIEEVDYIRFSNSRGVAVGRYIF